MRACVRACVGACVRVCVCGYNLNLCFFKSERDCGMCVCMGGGGEWEERYYGPKTFKITLHSNKYMHSDKHLFLTTKTKT